ncbi:BV/ODV-E26 [Lonomia obliqua multiple nucleopolyhedrovirus]|uniref:BV/ODV-E26 n=1 Tax=Lonomia obliqua multiple nucleopolyhedrovirus TaxID=134394 RepID=A0A126FCF7_9ABAC|nr:BV/ODV-E26 [Lonomia obliqua multiple nucleopolyhedrovirus]AKN81077.1 BV/ODV-E26 [Lonomia obliqua multiple nucleopolyhedrovirus]
MNCSPFRLPCLSVAEFAASKKFAASSFGGGHGGGTHQTLTTTTIATTTTTTAAGVENRLKRFENARKISHIISTLRETYVKFQKIQILHRQRVKQLKNLLKSKNEKILQLIRQINKQKPLSAARISCKKAKANSKYSRKYLGIVRCDNVIRTLTGSEHFVRRRIAEVCTLSKGEYVYCELYCGNERELIAKLLNDKFNTRVIVYDKSRKFEFLKKTDAFEAKHLILNHLQYGFNVKINTN